MKKIVVIFFILNVCFCFSQPKVIHVKKEKKAEVFTIVDEQAEFPGGMAGMSAFIRNNLVFPSRAKTDSTFRDCRVYVKFVVNEDGSTSDTEILKGCNGFPECDEESMRVIKNMPKWKPSKIAGKPVKSYYHIPISFKRQ